MTIAARIFSIKYSAVMPRSCSRMVSASKNSLLPAIFQYSSRYVLLVSIKSEQIFVVAQLGLADGAQGHHGRPAGGLQGDGVALMGGQGALQLPPAGGVGAVQPDPDLLAHQGVVVLGPGQPAAQPGGPHLQIIALGDGVGLEIGRASCRERGERSER